MNENCENCHWWRPIAPEDTVSWGDMMLPDPWMPSPAGPTKYYGYGHCHGAPPTSTAPGDRLGPPIAIWPVTGYADLCGAWTEKEDE
jgi:hypothetical protein